jgi:SSS family transporter
MNTTLSPWLIITILSLYFGALILISYLTSKDSDTETFFTGNKQSPWYLVAFGMIGASLSGVTFVSVPGAVIKNGMDYFQIVLGYTLGYFVIAKVLMPLYYKLNVTSIYEYLNHRFGVVSYKTGAAFFILSRTVGSALRLFIATEILHTFLFEAMGVAYWLTALITVLLIWVYTFKGGIKTIVYTDTFQTVFLISAVLICIVIIANALHVDLFSLYSKVSNAKTVAGNAVDGYVSTNQSLTRIFHFDDPYSKSFFFKQFFGGMFLAIAMTGLDQDLMQKNLTCKSIKDAQKNMYSFTVILVLTNFFFLLLGGALYVYANQKGIQLNLDATDGNFPKLALNNFGTIAGIFFLLGITASSYASADSALAALTTGFCIDFLNFSKRSEPSRKKLKLFVHIGFSLLFLIIVLLTKWYKQTNPNSDLITVILGVASYTYGPLLALFSFGLFVKSRKLHEAFVPFVCILVPIVCYFLPSLVLELTKTTDAAGKMAGGYLIGQEMLIINGFLTFLGLLLISKRVQKSEQFNSNEFERELLLNTNEPRTP